MSVFVIVDDSDQNLNYSPVVVSHGDSNDAKESAENGWYVATMGAQAEFQQTRTRSALPSSTMSYEFSGSSISVYGTVWGFIGTLGSVGSIISFSIDGTTIATTNTSQTPEGHRHVPLFVSPSLPANSTHNLTMEILAPNFGATNNSNVWIDYLIYEAVENSTVPTPTAQTSWIFIDDSSPYLEYGDDEWSGTIPYFTSNMTDVAFNSSVTGPTNTSSTVSLNFTGATMIRAFAMLTGHDLSDNLGTFSIDGGVETTLSSPSPLTTNLVSNYMILSSQVDHSDAPHQLVITAAAAGSFYLDYILLQSQSAFVTSQSLTTTGGSPVSSLSGTSSAVSGSVSVRPQDRSRSGGANVGGIAGGVVGGVAALIALGVVVVLMLRRRRKYAKVTPVRPSALFDDRYATTGLDSQMRDRAELPQHETTMRERTLQTPSESGYTVTPTPFNVFNSTTTSREKHTHRHSRYSGPSSSITEDFSLSRNNLSSAPSPPPYVRE